MEYQNYENYMRGILGYKPNYNNIYNNSFSNFGDDRYYQDYYKSPANISRNTDNDELNNMYPEIYKITYPIVCKLCNQNQYRKINQNLLDNMVTEVYNIIEPGESIENSQTKQSVPLRNGDVRNPNAKESEEKRETKKINVLLQDLIKILILGEFKNTNRLGEINPPPPPPRPQNPFYNQQYNYGRPF